MCLSSSLFTNVSKNTGLEKFALLCKPHGSRCTAQSRPESPRPGRAGCPMCCAARGEDRTLGSVHNYSEQW